MSLPDLVRSGDNKTVRRYLRKHSVSNDDLEEALIIAIREGYLDIIEIMLKYSPSDSIINEALIEAFESKNREIIKLLVRYSNETLKVSDGLIWAAAYGYLDLVKSTIKLPHIRDDDINKAFVKAAANAHIDVVRFLLNTGKIKDSAIKYGFRHMIDVGKIEDRDPVPVSDLLYSTGSIDDKTINTRFVNLAGRYNKHIIPLMIHMLKTSKITDYSINEAFKSASNVGNSEASILLLKTGKVTDEIIDESINNIVNASAYKLLEYIVKNFSIKPLSPFTVQKLLSSNIKNSQSANYKYLQFIIDNFYIHQNSIKASLRPETSPIHVNALSLLLNNIYDITVIDTFLTYLAYIVDSRYISLYLDNGLYEEGLLETAYRLANRVKTHLRDVGFMLLDNLSNPSDLNKEYFSFSDSTD